MRGRDPDQAWWLCHSGREDWSSINAYSTGGGAIDDPMISLEAIEQLQLSSSSMRRLVPTRKILYQPRHGSQVNERRSEGAQATG